MATISSQTRVGDSTPRAKSSGDFLADSYLASLLTYSLDTLSKEPAALKSQEEALQQELLETATKHYKGFIEAADSFHGVTAQVLQAKQQLEDLKDSLQGLQSQASAFSAAATDHQVTMSSTTCLCGFQSVSDGMMQDSHNRARRMVLNDASSRCCKFPCCCCLCALSGGLC